MPSHSFATALGCPGTPSLPEGHAQGQRQAPLGTAPGWEKACPFNGHASHLLF